jgi:hypothetical protein
MISSLGEWNGRCSAMPRSRPAIADLTVGISVLVEDGTALTEMFGLTYPTSPRGARPRRGAPSTSRSLSHEGAFRSIPISARTPKGEQALGRTDEVTSR